MSYNSHVCPSNMKLEPTDGMTTFLTDYVWAGNNFFVAFQLVLAKK